MKWNRDKRGALACKHKYNNCVVPEYVHAHCNEGHLKFQGGVEWAVICSHFNDCRPKCKWLIGGYMYVNQIAAIYIVPQVGIHLGLCWVQYVFILHIQNVFNSHRQGISGQRSEPNNTVSEFHLSAVEGMLSWELTSL